MTREQYEVQWDNIGRILKVCFDTTPVRKEWAENSYALTMPGNIEAYITAMQGGR